MKIGIDLSPLQGPHKMRGIGAVTTNIIDNIQSSDKKNIEFVFYVDDMVDEDKHKFIENSLNTDDLKYVVRKKPEYSVKKINLPYKLNLISKIIYMLRATYRFYRGIKGYAYDDLDVYIHTDQLLAMPKMPKIKKIIIAYDLIPYILESDYLWGYSTARKNGLNKKASIAALVRRRNYYFKLIINTKRADLILAISNSTKSDIIKYLGVSSSKISVWYLGSDSNSRVTKSIMPSHRYVKTSWGNIRRPYSPNLKIPYLLFLGGTDERRRLDDLVLAFNHLRAQGLQLQLYLSGDILQGSDNLPVKRNREALSDSSYKEDIVYFGYTNEAEKKWLYENSLAFIYPSIYEGFGLPILEAMVNGAPVITYKNSSLFEVAKNHALYANDGFGIMVQVEQLLDNNIRNNYIRNGRIYASAFSWDSSVRNLMQILFN